MANIPKNMIKLNMDSRSTFGYNILISGENYAEKEILNTFRF